MQVGSLFLGTYDFAQEPFDWGGDESRVPHHLKASNVWFRLLGPSCTAMQAQLAG